MTRKQFETPHDADRHLVRTLFGKPEPEPEPERPRGNYVPGEGRTPPPPEPSQEALDRAMARRLFTGVDDPL